MAPWLPVICQSFPIRGAPPIQQILWSVAFRENFINIWPGMGLLHHIILGTVPLYHAMQKVMYCKTRELILFFCQIESKGFHCDCLCQRRLLISVKPKSLVTMMTESSVRAGTAPPERTICQRAPVNPSILLILEVSGMSYRSDVDTQEHILLERSARLNLDPKI